MARSANGVFISYRRNESGHAAGRLADRLGARIRRSRIFMDVDGIGPGDDFTAALTRAIRHSGVLVAIIGPRWSDTLREHDGRPDWVRREISLALNSGIRVIPVLVDGARMPEPVDLPDDLRGLATRNAVTIDLGSFSADIDRLIDSVLEILPHPRGILLESYRSDARAGSPVKFRPSGWLRIVLSIVVSFGTLFYGLTQSGVDELLFTFVGISMVVGFLIGLPLEVRRQRRRKRTYV